jgi:dTDP-4-amino-4,6-dideoxygalactose transaminase
MKVGFYGHVKQYQNIQDEIDANMQEVMMSGKYISGPMLASFEEELKEYMGTKYAIGVGNGTDAIWLSLMALGIGKGDEVITNANTFFATAEAAWIAGCKVVLVDCDPKTKCIDPKKIEAAVTDKTKAIIPVHLYGQCADMKAIKAIADKHNLLVIEDNAQGIDGYGDGFKQGELSDTVCTSFIIQKNLGCFGDGGAVFTNNAEVNRIVRKLRNHGSDKRSCHSPGFNSRLDDIQAGVLSAKMKHISEWTDQRIAIAALYNAALAGCETITLPYVTPGYRHVFHLYVVETKDPAKRAELLSFLQSEGVDAKTHYSISIHKQDGYPWGKECEVRGSLENAERNADSCVSLPMFPELTCQELQCVIAKVCEWDAANR